MKQSPKESKKNNGLKVPHEVLDAEREKFADLYDFAPVGYLILDHLGIIEEVNNTGVHLLGYSKSTLRNRRFQSFLASHSLDEFYGFLHKMKESNEKITTEIKLNTANKKSLYTRIEGIVIPDFVSSNFKYYITLIDITESREMQTLLRETKERLEMTLKASSTGIWSIESENNQMVLDEYCYQVLEFKPEEFSGNIKDFFSLVHPGDRERVRESYMHSLNNSLEIDMEFRIVLKKGNIKFISTKGHKIKITEDHQFFSGIIMDITERKRLAAEAENLKVKQQRKILTATINAQESERFKISRALHDSVCQVLYGIRLNLQSIAYYKKNREEFKSVNHLLDQAIKETRDISYELTPSVLRDFGFIAGVKEMASRLSTLDFSIKTTISQSLDEVNGTIQLYAFRIIQELINNCIKHANATQANIKVWQQDDVIAIRVSDNGKGFKTDLSQALTDGSGLRGIKNQLVLLNGDMEFKRTAKETRITITFMKNVSLD